ncbi:MAG: hypothetical protein ACTSP4_01915 [Candidatus Hodarchaeales archaeon]
MKIEFDLGPDFEEKMKEIAAGANINIDAAAKLIVEGFCDRVGSRIYTGSWSKGRDGDHRGMRYVVQFAPKPAIFKVRGDVAAEYEKK